MNHKIHKLFSLILALLFIVAVQVFARPVPVFRFLVPSFLLYAGVLTFYNYWMLRQIGKLSFWLLIRPVLFLVALFGLLLILPTQVWRGFLLILSLPAIYFEELALGSASQHILFNEVVIAAFGFLMAVVAWSSYFPVSAAAYLFAVFGFIVLQARSAFEFTPKSGAAKWLAALAVGFFTAEFFWVLNFLPLHYSALGLILFNLFYFCWALYYYFLIGQLTPRKSQFHFALALGFSLLILLVTPWRILP